ncbi:hypothetical protein [Burkholderia multivorans]|uniref:hypothetical protein n=1 Tax=Burkholderia multivorans TaxID=87883 RepID=UPI000CFFE6AB|nr:hypothetical protein [Burkholderia multivorans]MBR8243892.1 hypothetical protein [Burkholderia multivorans]MDN7945040.1 hypothetical protein [Burkholderia multivorans]MDR9174546.1 hypothetical protein [Burkholderia multivorans]MDR9179855.1 hypothetical protein [Burkholderia multivorans]MDR9185327.1 hypothetical protein [Burkholderia multivorans]
MQHYFILNDKKEPVEVHLETFSKWDKDIGDTTVAQGFRVWTVFLGVTNDRDPPEVPYFTHFIIEPGSLYRTVNTYGYDNALARHGRIAEWLKGRAERRAQKQATREKNSGTQ